MEQISLFESKEAPYIVERFSADGFCDDSERRKLEVKYRPLLEITSKFDRQSVSYQLSKNEALHSWLKYREGFSANLVRILLDEMNVIAGDTIVDPFMGSGTTALVCQMRGIDSVGYDVLPISKVAVKAKSSAMRYNISELEALAVEFSALTLPENYTKSTPYITITNTAYPQYNERFIQFATDWIFNSGFSEEAKNLFILCMVNSLERSSYTSKSGQYLSWDSRSQKIIEANEERIRSGRRLLPENYCRKNISNVKDAVTEELNHVLRDIVLLQAEKHQETGGHIRFYLESALFELPLLKENFFKGVITSPPYCNRYDYTRTYALELVYLGETEESIKKLRQKLLSCTVESKSKMSILRDFYKKNGMLTRFDSIHNVIEKNPVLAEILSALRKRKANGDLNNNGVIRMVEGYFTELSFVYSELYRICKPGAFVAFVNDNVRYGGEVIPVDFLSTNLAEQFGFTPVTVYCLKQQKGNSSQQMKKYGRVPLRKSITIWKKS